MGSRKVIQTYYTDINNLADLLGKLVNSYRLLIGGADELNKIALSRKSDVRDALKRADKLGDIIDEIIDMLEKSSNGYLDYCELKSDIIKGKLNEGYIYTEIEEDLNFKD
ncbi:hypothetical protein [Clostridium colicanis]|uniref:Uncharacterized protein n=1 Tax=Clostridium colicanis DSM 13634 TaxID=1121305 RepID=A0A151AN93_9CLOT|nr:hypothetical protein [Clostridium colicanis]KYH29093.1 hypothetical protein CLCOL_12290 [Clostridium colicanis DSM 13634]